MIVERPRGPNTSRFHELLNGWEGDIDMAMFEYGTEFIMGIPGTENLFPELSTTVPVSEDQEHYDRVHDVICALYVERELNSAFRERYSNFDDRVNWVELGKRLKEGTDISELVRPLLELPSTAEINDRVA